MSAYAFEWESWSVADLTVRIVADDNPMDPRDADNVGIMLAEGHRRYTLGDKPYSKHVPEYDELAATLRYCFERRGARGLAIFARWLRIYRGATAVLPLYLYDHGGLAMSTGPFPLDPQGWDSGLVGFIFDTAERRETTGCAPDGMAALLQNEVEVYSAYLQGQVVGYVVEKTTTCDLGHTHTEVIDSCWSYIIRDSEHQKDMAYVRDEARAAAKAMSVPA